MAAAEEEVEEEEVAPAPEPPEPFVSNYFGVATAVSQELPEAAKAGPLRDLLAALCADAVEVKAEQASAAPPAVQRAAAAEARLGQPAATAAAFAEGQGDNGSASDGAMGMAVGSLS